MLPAIQNVANALIMAPRFSFGWNSLKYEKQTGRLPPALKQV